MDIGYIFRGARIVWVHCRSDVKSFDVLMLRRIVSRLDEVKFEV